MKKTALLLTALTIALVQVSCRHSDEESAAAHVVPVQSVMRRYFADDDSTRCMLALLPEVAAFMSAANITAPDTASPAARLLARQTDVFGHDVDSIFTDTALVSHAIGRILARAAENNLPLTPRRYATVVYGRQQSILFVDSVMLIALNHYLGSDYAGYAGMYDYRRALKTPAALPADMAEAIVATDYPYAVADASDATLISHMLYAGALTEARMRLSGADLATALGYDQEQLRFLADNYSAIRQELAAGNLLYDTSRRTIDAYMQPSPAVRTGSLVLPGRAGRYIGYRIVRQYLDDHPGTTLRQLLDPAFYTKPQAL